MEIQVENGRVIYPFSAEIDSSSGKMDIDVTHTERFLSNLVNVFAETNAAEGLLKKKGDILIYVVYEKGVPEANGEISSAQASLTQVR